MTSGYPSNQDEAGEFRPTGSLGDDDNSGTQPRQPLSGLEVAIIVATVASFLLVVFFVFYCRRVEQRRRARDGARRVDGSRVEEQLGIPPGDVPRPVARSGWLAAVVERFRKFPGPGGSLSLVR